MFRWHKTQTQDPYQTKLISFFANLPNIPTMTLYCKFILWPPTWSLIINLNLNVKVPAVDWIVLITLIMECFQIIYDHFTFYCNLPSPPAHLQTQIFNKGKPFESFPIIPCISYNWFIFNKSTKIYYDWYNGWFKKRRIFSILDI